MKDELNGKIVENIFQLRVKTCSYLKDNRSKYQKTKGTKKCVIKRKIKFEDYKNCFEATKIENKINQLEKNTTSIDSFKESHKEHTFETNVLA